MRGVEFVEQLVLANLAQLTQVHGRQPQRQDRSEHEAFAVGPQTDGAGHGDRQDLGGPAAPTLGRQVAHGEEDVSTVEGQDGQEVEQRPPHVDPHDLGEHDGGGTGRGGAARLEHDGRKPEQHERRERSGQARDDPSTRAEHALGRGQATEPVQHHARREPVGAKGHCVTHLVDEDRDRGNGHPAGHESWRLGQAQQHDDHEERRFETHGNPRQAHLRCLHHGPRLRPTRTLARSDPGRSRSAADCTTREDRP